MKDLVARAALEMAGSMEVSIVVKATAILLLCLGAARLARSARASVRGVLLASAFGVLLALPVATVVVPPIAFEVPVADVRDVSTPSATQEGTLAGDINRPSVGNQKTTKSSREFPATALVRSVWAIAGTACLVPIAVTVARLRRLRRNGLPWPKGEALVHSLAGDAGVRRPVDILIHEELVAPMTCGFLRPAIMMPPEVEDWSDAELEHAIVHELEHVRRGDWPVHLTARAVCALYWFHPLVWTAWRHLRLESERACDDAVLRRAEGTAYAEQLLSLARRLSDTRGQPVLAMANRSDLFTRVSAVLDRHQRRGRASLFYAMVTIAGALTLMLGLSPLCAAPEPALRAQAPPAGESNPSFEVASIKQSKTTGRGVFRAGRGLQASGRYVATNLTVKALIQNAYDLQNAQLIGGPDWLETDGYDIEAKAPDDAPRTGTQLQLMMRSLLVERFKLAMHKETRPMSVFALVKARGDGRLGPDLKVASEANCGPPVALPPSGAPPLPPPPPPPPPGGPGAPPGGPGLLGSPPCGATMFGPGQFVGRAIPIEQFARMLSNVPAVTGVDRIVLDKTGLTGKYDYQLKFHSVQPPAAATDDRPSFITALQEQLGLKLEPERAPIEVLVIDHVERPSED
jgi:bla regulator protein blaR1